MFFEAKAEQIPHTVDLLGQCLGIIEKWERINIQTNAITYILPGSCAGNEGVWII